MIINFFALLVIVLFINLPLVSALEISAVQVSNLTDKEAVVEWKTDQPADSFVDYGSSKDSLTSVGDASLVNEHKVPLHSLAAEMTYYYSVKSGDVKDDNSGNLYSFTTPAPDVTPPEIVVEIPAFVKGSMLDIKGKSEIGAAVNIYVDGSLMGSTTAVSEGAEGGLEGVFSFSNIQLKSNQDSNIRIEAMDKAGNKASVEGKVFADTGKPKIKLESAPAVVGDRKFILKGTISEESSFEIFVNNKSAGKGEGKSIEQEVRLEEGKNSVKVTAADKAGWEAVEELVVEADAKPPTVEAEIEKGYEYYEGRAESAIHGTTEPGAKVYLYIYRPLGYQFNPDFKKARDMVTADEKGEFTFEETDFSVSVLDRPIEELAPKEVPSGLQKFTIFPVEQVAAQQRYSYYVFIIAEDKAGKTGYWQKVVNVHTCYSADFDFGVDSLPKFQAPLRLVPQLLDSGRQEIQTVFQFDYLGKLGVPKIVNNEQVEKGAKIVSATFEKACTKSMTEDSKFGLGCKILPAKEGHQIISPDRSAVYVTWKLFSTKEFSRNKEDFWNEFKKRQVIFPLKIRVQYQERTGENQWGPIKTQTSCYELGYFVDIPIESKNMIPDFLAEDSVEALDWTIKQIQTIRPYLEKAYIITGISCMASWLLRTATRWGRILTSRMEYVYTQLRPAEEAEKKGEKFDKETQGCPSPAGQYELYLEDTIENWKTLDPNTIPKKVAEALNDPEKLKAFTLEERCPSTASAWKFEAALNQAYQWTCDRSFCRKVPAGWTAEKTTDQIGEVVLKQQQCAVSGRGVPLMKRENCQELVKANPINMPTYVDASKVSVCWQTADGTLYYYNEQGLAPDEREETTKGIYRLTPVGNVLGDLAPAKERLIAYKPEDSEGYIVGKERNCKDVCNNPRKPEYKADTENSVDGKGCYDEKIDTDGQVRLFGKGEKRLGEAEKEEGRPANKYAAGYTKDCFIKGYEKGKAGDIEYSGGEPLFQQCVCVGKKEESNLYKSNDLSLRTAVRKEGEKEEEWFYQQERVFTESRKTKGTYYPPERYYSGRDFSGAFGQDYLLDYFRGENKEVAEINPHSQIIGMFQSLCLSAILKNMRMLESILTGLRNCLIEAKYTGLHDAGMCKTMFAQNVCGLIYKAIGYLTSGCHSLNFEDVGKEGAFGDVGMFVSEGFDSMDAAVESSIDDLREDYGNAALNEYFKGGTQGFAQSMCLAAFGYEFPLFSEEFLLDAAYATPMKSSIIVAPAERELSTYNPAQQTAVFNYNIGGVILPGCRIRQWKLSLKCIGAEDLGRPGVDTTCSGKGCDCINAQSIVSPLEAEKTRMLASGFNLPSGQMFSIPLESPQRVDSHYRYDHALVELVLDPSEKGNEEKCFDEGYYESMKGIFYVPLTDVSPPAELICKADLTTGRYVCPELSGMFGFGGAYIEEPFVSCWDKKTESWVNCETPNMFLLNDPIKIKVHLSMDDKGKCLGRKINPLLPGLVPDGIRTLPANVPGPLTVEENLGIVNAQIFGGAYTSIQKTAASDLGCGLAIKENPPEATEGTAGQKFEFNFIPQPDGTVQLKMSGNVNLKTAGYDNSEGYLKKDGTLVALSPADVNKLEFNLGGYVISDVSGTASVRDKNILCAYEIVKGGLGTTGTNARNIHVTYELLERDEGGGCALARQPVKTAIGKSSATQRILLQKEEVAFAEAGGMHQSFVSRNYERTGELAIGILKEKKGDLNNAVAVYYGVASLIMKGGGFDKYKDGIINLLKVFFERVYGGEKLEDYDEYTKGSTEFRKINKYLCEVAAKVGYAAPLSTSPGECS
ncbi:MAG: hypothetical protein AB1668_04620 [Nanoarchaeota archaeon]